MSRKSFARCTAALGLTVGFASVALGGPADRTIALPPADMYPEGIGMAANGDIYVGSLKRSEIWRVDGTSGAASLFAGAEAGLMSVIGVHVSADGDRIYACSSDIRTEQAGTKTELVVLDRADGTVLARHAFPGGGFCNDIAERADGTILATDSFVPRILALRPGGGFGEWLRDDSFAGEGISLNGIAEIDGYVYVVKFSSGEMLRIDDSGATPRIEAVDLGRPLARPDGLELLSDGRLLLIEAGSGSLLRIAFTDGGLAGDVETIRADYLTPTTVAARNGEAFVVQGQLDRLFGRNPTPAVPFEIRVTPLL